MVVWIKCSRASTSLSHEDREIENERSSIFIDKNLQHAETAIYRDGAESKDIVVVSASCAISTFRARHFSPFRAILYVGDINILTDWKLSSTLRRSRKSEKNSILASHFPSRNKIIITRAMYRVMLFLFNMVQKSRKIYIQKEKKQKIEVTCDKSWSFNLCEHNNSVWIDIDSNMLLAIIPLSHYLV